MLGDQLNYRHSWFRKADPGVTYLMMELRQETDYVEHHARKILAFFASMRAFRRHMESKGHRFIYLTLDDPGNTQSLDRNVRRLVAEHDFDAFEYLLPDEYRLDRQLLRLKSELEIPVATADTEHFLTSRSELGELFRDRKTYRMETFYRHMRRRHHILMDGDAPLTGRWNYDRENRQAVGGEVRMPPPRRFRHDTGEILETLLRSSVKTMGEHGDGEVILPVNRRESLALLRHFLQRCLRLFGTYQDAMTTRSETLFHSRLSFALNTKMLHPLEVIRKTLAYWKAHPEVDIAQVEGFIRQILGWREYVRGVYWEKMPKYERSNFFSNRRRLPSFYWTGRTRMNCMARALGQSLRTAYAHHIQRLMVTGNFALLAGIHPQEVDRWYLGVYADAVQWVEITNTRGMSQFADGGVLATKPYAGSAAYINRMSDYCRTCSYRPDRRHGQDACPFNSLFWHFFARNRSRLDRNPRLGLTYRNLDAMPAAERRKTMAWARSCLRRLDDL
jgi:deoxyribodipyrimidine photolyase-related protein